MTYRDPRGVRVGPRISYKYKYALPYHRPWLGHQIGTPINRVLWLIATNVEAPMLGKVNR